MVIYTRHMVSTFIGLLRLNYNALLWWYTVFITTHVLYYIPLVRDELRGDIIRVLLICRPVYNYCWYVHRSTLTADMSTGLHLLLICRPVYNYCWYVHRSTLTADMSTGLHLLIVWKGKIRVHLSLCSWYIVSCHFALDVDSCHITIQLS